MTIKQKTLKEVAVVEGIGVFTGAYTKVEIHPAPVDHGPSFQLVKAGTVIDIPVSVDNVIETENRTVLANPENQEHQIHIVEHVLATLHGMGVDNAIVKVDSNEVPLIDGSALPFLLAIDKAGLVEQDAERKEIVIEKPVFIDDDGLLMVLPCDRLEITYYLDHPNDIVGKRLAHIEATEENFRKRIGPSRTFMKVEKVNELLASGAVKHGDHDQALVVYKDRTSAPLRFANEYCYHKMLDILGDMYLLGRRLRGHVIGIRSGHFQNRKLAGKIAEEMGQGRL